jgi:hypothetical protein
MIRTYQLGMVLLEHALLLREGRRLERETVLCVIKLGLESLGLEGGERVEKWVLSKSRRREGRKH